jgi:hypothetical protein
MSVSLHTTAKHYAKLRTRLHWTSPLSSQLHSHCPSLELCNTVGRKLFWIHLLHWSVCKECRSQWGMMKFRSVPKKRCTYSLPKLWSHNYMKCCSAILVVLLLSSGRIFQSQLWLSFLTLVSFVLQCSVPYVMLLAFCSFPFSQQYSHISFNALKMASCYRLLNVVRNKQHIIIFCMVVEC